MSGMGAIMASISGSGTGCAERTTVSATSRGSVRGRQRAGRTRAGWIALAAGPMIASLIGAAPVGSLDVTLDKVRSAKGLMRVCLTADPANFPNCVDDRDAVTRTIPAGQHHFRFAALPPGDYAVAVIHDENGNARLDTFAGIPKEGFGFSRNPPIRFGPPRFAAARFTLAGDAEQQQVTMRYIL